MQTKNQIVVISGILALLATATIAGSYNLQIVKAASNNNNFGNTASHQAQDGQNDQTGGHGLDANSNNHDPDFGKAVSGCATGTSSSTHCH